MENKLTLNKMSPAFDNGMPIGNGRLGAMIKGNIGGVEKIELNEDSLWSVPFINRNNPDAKKYLSKIRELIKSGENLEADKLCMLAMTSIPKYFGSYEPMCNLHLQMNFGQGGNENYKRELDLQNGIACVDFFKKGVPVHREAFISFEYQAIIIKFKAEKPILDLHINLMRRPYETYQPDFIDGDILHLKGRAGDKGVSFNCLVSGKTDGEMITIGDYLYFKNASDVTLYITANTDFYEQNPLLKSKEQMEKVKNADYETVKEKHIADFSGLYNRTLFDFGSKNDISVDERLQKIREGSHDTGILELFLNFAKYLTISASRPMSQAMNLQGIWNDKYAPSWECNYTININTQMNYWICESTGLPECHEPLFDLIERMVPNGEVVADEVYGCKGFVAHHATNIWGDCAIEGNSFPSSLWPVGGAWLIKHMWDHYLYTGDKKFLKERAFPIMKKAAMFFTEYMQEAEDGYFETGPSLSPENFFINEKGVASQHCMAPEMDNQIIRSLFRSLIKTYKILGIDDSEYKKYKDFISKIRPTKINKNGGIMEWNKDFDEYDPGHRHISPLFALHPDYEITPDKTPQLADACKKTISRRMGGSDIESIEGFSYWNGAWISCCYSRLGMSEEALNALYGIFRRVGGVSNSLLVRAPIFQIESNFGIAAAIIEMLMFCDEEKISLLPSLPDDLSDGKFKGLCSRGGFVFNVEWKNKKAIKASMYARYDNICRIKCEGVKGVNTDFQKDGEYIIFSAKADTGYEFIF